MAEDPVITDEMRSMIGVESDTSVYEIEKGAIRKWADAIGDPNPLYHDEKYAKKRGYRSIIAPPAFIAHYAFPIEPSQKQVSIRNPFTRRLNGGNEYESFQAIQAGDFITSTTKVAELFEREGRLGKMLFIIYETTHKNQEGGVVAKARKISINY